MVILRPSGKVCCSNPPDFDPSISPGAGGGGPGHDGLALGRLRAFGRQGPEVLSWFLDVVFSWWLDVFRYVFSWVFFDV